MITLTSVAYPDCVITIEEFYKDYFVSYPPLEIASYDDLSDMIEFDIEQKGFSLNEPLSESDIQSILNFTMKNLNKYEQDLFNRIGQTISSDDNSNDDLCKGFDNNSSKKKSIPNGKVQDGLSNTRLFKQLNNNLKKPKNKLLENFTQIGDGLFFHLDYLTYHYPIEELFEVSKLEDFINQINVLGSPLGFSNYGFTEKNYQHYPYVIKSSSESFMIGILPFNDPKNINEEFPAINIEPDWDISTYLDVALSKYKYASISILISGKYLSYLSLDKQLSLCYEFAKHGGYPRRLDSTIDDIINDEKFIDNIVLACKQGNCFHFKKYHFHESGEMGQPSEKTVNLGSRGNSAKFIRVYDKRKELGAIRYEIEARRGLVRGHFNEIISYYESELLPLINNGNYQLFKKKIALFAVSFAKTILNPKKVLDFRDRSSDSCQSRTKRLDFWDNFLKRINEEGSLFQVTRIKPEPSILGTLNWVKRNWSRTIAKLVLAFGADSFNQFAGDLVQKGMSQLNHCDFTQVNEFTDQVPVASYKHLLKCRYRFDFAV